MRQTSHASDAAGGVKWAVRPNVIQRGADREEIRKSANIAQKGQEIRFGPSGGIGARQTYRQIDAQRDRAAFGVTAKPRQKSQNISNQARRI
jgi:hypothetical protein